jgi:hypothetical protein
MKLYFTLLSLLVAPFFGTAQTYSTVKGKIVKSDNLSAMDSVNILNLNQVIGTTTNSVGDFEQALSVPIEPKCQISFKNHFLKSLEK